MDDPEEHFKGLKASNSAQICPYSWIKLEKTWLNTQAFMGPSVYYARKEIALWTPSPVAFRIFCKQSFSMHAYK